MNSATYCGADGVLRCAWAEGDESYTGYHDLEWARPGAMTDAALFERLTLESFQSGLSWRTILGKREGFRAAFAGFDFDRVARFGARDVTRLLGDASIVRHRGKIEATINNAKRALDLVEREGSLAGRLCLALRAEQEDGGRGAGGSGHRSLGGDVEGPEEAWLELRRSDHGLRVHAGDGPGQRPRAGLRRLPEGREGPARVHTAGPLSSGNPAAHRATRCLAVPRRRIRGSSHRWPRPAGR